MTRDDIIRSFLNLHPDTQMDGQQYAIPLRAIKQIADAVAAAEREECAKLCLRLLDDEDNEGAIYAAAIRARGQS